MDNSKIKALWKSFGGGQHGPHIETMTIPESGFYAFCQAALLAAEERGRVAEREAFATAMRRSVDWSSPTSSSVACGIDKGIAAYEALRARASTDKEATDTDLAKYTRANGEDR